MPRCGRVLKDLRLPAFCDGCGQPLAVPLTASKHRWQIFLTVAEIVAIGVALLARANGLPPAGALVLLVLINILAAAIYFTWHRAVIPAWNRSVLPAARKVEDRGLVGISRSLYQRFLSPVLFGKKGRRPQS
jgi:hypothetical protein